MIVTDVRIFLRNEDRVKAYCSIVLDNAIAVHNLRILTSTTSDKMIVAMPSKQDRAGEYRDICHPISADARKTIEDAVLTKYRGDIQKLVDTQTKFAPESTKKAA